MCLFYNAELLLKEWGSQRDEEMRQESETPLPEALNLSCESCYSFAATCAAARIPLFSSKVRSCSQKGKMKPIKTKPSWLSSIFFVRIFPPVFEQVLSHNFIAAVAVKGYWRHSRERDVWCERARYTRLAGFNLAQLRLSTACCTSSKWQSERKDQWAWNFNICLHGAEQRNSAAVEKLSLLHAHRLFVASVLGSYSPIIKQHHLSQPSRGLVTRVLW